MTFRLAIIMALVAGCTTAPGSTLDGTEWLSTAVTEDGADHPLVDGTQIRLAFADGQVNASVGCNTIGGAYRVEDGQLIFEGGGMTEMGCDDERHAQDDWLAGFLGSRPALVREGDKLTMTSGATVIALEDRERVEPDLALTGTTWTVDSIVTGDAVSSVPGDAVATLVFTDDGRVEIDTGCNVGGGVYEMTDGTLRVGEVMITRRACKAAEGQLEAAVMAVLNGGDLEWAIEAGSLTLMAGDDGLGLRGG